MNQKSGLGNQLFQYAAGLFFAQQLSALLSVIAEPPALAHAQGAPRPFLLDRFQITAPVRARNRLDRLLCSSKPGTAVLSSALRALTGTMIYREPVGRQWLFAPTLPVPAGTRTLYLEGYWQAHQYVQAVAPELRRQLVPAVAPGAGDRSVLDRIHSGPGMPVSLHIRRGDQSVAIAGTPPLGLPYYRNAIAAIHERVAGPVFFVFSDDIAWARAHLPAGERLVFVDHNDDHTSHQDLHLMSACRHHVIANSTFSWWGAWLDPRPDKWVLAPDRWLDNALPHTDLLPPDWLVIPSRDADGRP